MVKDPRTKIRPHRLRPLADPRAARVQTDDRGRPQHVLFEGMVREVTCLQDRWRIDDEWWREATVSRMYYEVQLEGDRLVTLYQDLPGGTWWLQRY